MNKENNTYSINIEGCQRELPLCPINENMTIAAFIMFGDVEITEKAAKKLLSKCPEFDVLITAETKGIPLCYEMAKQSGKKYVVARKFSKLYMKNPVKVEVKSITTATVQNLFLSELEFEQLCGKKILIVDDVISTGQSLIAIEALVNQAAGKVVGKACVLAEGDAYKRNDIIYLVSLPVFTK